MRESSLIQEAEAQNIKSFIFFFLCGQGNLKTDLNTDTHPRKTQKQIFRKGKSLLAKVQGRQTEKLVCRIQELKEKNTTKIARVTSLHSLFMVDKLTFSHDYHTKVVKYHYTQKGKY